jgi:hypothetical protein
LELDLDLELRLDGSKCWFAWVSGGLEWPGMRRRLDLVELDDGNGGLAGVQGEEGAGEVVVVVVVVCVAVVAVVVTTSSSLSALSGGGSGSDSDVEVVALGFDLAADTNSAGNGVLLAAKPQAYSISLLARLAIACTHYRNHGT